MAAQFPIAVHVNASGTSRTARKIAKLATDIRRPITRAMAAIGRSTASAIRGVGRLGVGLAKLGTVAISGAIVGGWKLAASYAAATDAMAKAARRSGMTTQAFRELQHAAALAGVGGGEFATSIEKLTRNLGELRAGQGALYTLLRKTSPEFLATLQAAEGTTEAFDLLSDAIARLPGEEERAALAAAAFGRSGVKMTLLLQQGSDAIAKQREEARKYGGVIGEDAAKQAEAFVDAQTKMNLALSGLRVAIGSTLLPILKPLVDSTRDWVVANKQWIATGIGNAVRDVGKWLKSLDFESLRQQAEGLVSAVMRYDWQGLGQGLSAVASAASVVASGFRAVGEALGHAAAVVAISLLRVRDMAASLWRSITRAWESGSSAISSSLAWLDESWSALWGGIRSTLDDAWAAIRPIIDAITGAVDRAAQAVRDISYAAGITSAAERVGAPQVASPEQAAQAHAAAVAAARGAAPAQAVGGSAEVRVRFENAPPGLRVEKVSSDSGSLGVTAEVGRRMVGGEI